MDNQRTNQTKTRIILAVSIISIALCWGLAFFADTPIKQELFKALTIIAFLNLFRVFLNAPTTIEKN
jgi:hypothetical protein